jgi:hypothetical protein
MPWDPPDGVALFDSPEEAALAGWAHTPGAGAVVVETRAADDEDVLWVVLQLGSEPSGFHDQDIVTVVRTAAGRWWSNGSTGGSSG